MHYRRRVVYIFSTVVFVSCSAALAQGESSELEAIRAELGELKKSVQRIEQMLKEQTSPSEFSPVSIRVESEKGEPLSGYTVRFLSGQNEGRHLSASGTADESGIAFDRELPYGEYGMQVKHAFGWFAYFDKVIVELGNPLEMTVVAPDPAERATVQLRSSLEPDRFSGLFFGEMQRRSTPHSNRYTMPSAPEPGDAPGDWVNFPKVGNGVDRIALQVWVSTSRSIRQPDGHVQEWRWLNSDMNGFHLTNKGVSRILEHRGETSTPRDGAEFFTKPPDNDDDDHVAIAYQAIVLEPMSGESATVEIASGEVELSLRKIKGHATTGVIESLGLTPEVSEVWLPAEVEFDSEWIQQNIDLASGWSEPAKFRSSTLAKYRQSVEAGESLEIVFRSP